MNKDLTALFSQAPGLASSFDNIFKNPTVSSVAPPTPAAPPEPGGDSLDDDDWPAPF
jgi:hypothetical protein